jgi:hypothetical protein
MAVFLNHWSWTSKFRSQSAYYRHIFYYKLRKLVTLQLTIFCNTNHFVLNVTITATTTAAAAATITECPKVTVQ